MWLKAQLKIQKGE